MTRQHGLLYRVHDREQSTPEPFGPYLGSAMLRSQPRHGLRLIRGFASGIGFPLAFFESDCTYYASTLEASINRPGWSRRTIRRSANALDGRAALEQRLSIMLPYRLPRESPDVLVWLNSGSIRPCIATVSEERFPTGGTALNEISPRGNPDAQQDSGTWAAGGPE